MWLFTVTSTLLYIEWALQVLASITMKRYSVMTKSTSRSKRHCCHENETRLKRVNPPAPSREKVKRLSVRGEEKKTPGDGHVFGTADNQESSSTTLRDTVTGRFGPATQGVANSVDSLTQRHTELSSSAKLPSSLISSHEATNDDSTVERAGSFLQTALNESPRKNHARGTDLHINQSHKRFSPGIDIPLNVHSHDSSTFDLSHQQRQAAQRLLSRQRTLIRRNPKAKFIIAPAFNPFRRILPSEQRFGRAENPKSVLGRILYRDPSWGKNIVVGDPPLDGKCAEQVGAGKGEKERWSRIRQSAIVGLFTKLWLEVLRVGR